MFTGIIQSVGRVVSIQEKAGDKRVVIDAAKLSIKDAALGDSVAVSGICLTIVEKYNGEFAADVSNETLRRTVAGGWKPGTRVNLELALTPSSRLGGHLVSGHVDGVGTVLKRWHEGRSERFTLRAPRELAKYIAQKGSICVDGVSLTVNAVQGTDFELNIVPHTLQETCMGEYQENQRVNLEVDLIARYLERLLLGDKAAEIDNSTSGTVNEAFLSEHGFLK